VSPLAGCAAEALGPRAPVPLGVASGYPTSGGVVLWTRLAPEPLAPDGVMQDRPVAVTSDVAADPGFARIARRGAAIADPGLAHGVHVDVDGLPPARAPCRRSRSAGLPRGASVDA
jgi:alkaline phosphatase D